MSGARFAWPNGLRLSGARPAPRVFPASRAQASILIGDPFTERCHAPVLRPAAHRLRRQRPGRYPDPRDALPERRRHAHGRLFRLRRQQAGDPPWGHRGPRMVGLNDYAKRRARDLAELGYSALAIDMYGEGKHTEHPQDAMAFMQAATRDADAAKARFLAGLELLKRQPQTDPSQIAAIGYRFGGKIVLDMARQACRWPAWRASTAPSAPPPRPARAASRPRSWWSTAAPTAWSRQGPRRPETGTERRRRRLPGGDPGRRQTRLHQPRRRRAQRPRPGHRLRPPGRPALLGRPAGVPQDIFGQG